MALYSHSSVLALIVFLSLTSVHMSFAARQLLQIAGHVTSITGHANTAHSRTATVASYFFANAANYSSDFDKANIATFAKHPNSVSAKSNTANHAHHPNHHPFDSKHSDYPAQYSVLLSTSVNHQPMRCQRFHNPHCCNKLLQQDTLLELPKDTDDTLWLHNHQVLGPLETVHLLGQKK
ncbi:hypothetical protein RJ640_011931 [Escallonia rubra]|uniref:Uncharacterized protein n=1 Tax=Escallonia rubra TaxID=112253 RepID=A0AA88RGY2_9ASTE|nr:hypothetical protein RJ640_011931 [Escallonia rubra]